MPAVKQTAQRKQPAQSLGDRSVVEAVTEQLAYRVMAGLVPPGECLPSVRALAQAYGINPSTVQIIAARLQAEGFIDARQGVGLVVRDIDVYGGIPTWKYVFRFARELPDRAVKLLGHLLEMRLTLIQESELAIARHPDKYDLSAVRRAVEKLAAVAAAGPGNESAFAWAELHASRMVFLAVDQPVKLALFNSIGEILFDFEPVVNAMYAQPLAHVAIWQYMLDQRKIGKINEATVHRSKNLVRQYDRETLRRFESEIRKAKPTSQRARTANARAAS